MKIKRFRAASMAAAMEQIRREAGKDAVILETKNVAPEGLLNWFNRACASFGFKGRSGEIEVTVAWEQPGGASPEAYRRAVQAVNLAERKTAPLPAPIPVGKPDPVPAGKPEPVDNEPEEADEEEMWEIELRRLRVLLGQTLHRLDVPKGFHEPEMEFYPDWLEPYRGLLLRHHVSQTLIRAVLDPISQEETDRSSVEDRLVGSLAELIGRCRPIRLSKPGKTILLVGPTGAGKTTTLAKLAAYFRIERGKRVGLITCDTFRLGADEHLRRYGDLLDIDVKVARDIPELVRWQQELSGHDLILIDSAGHNHRDELKMEELEEIIRTLASVEVHLVVPVTLQEEHLASLIQRYHRLKVKRLIFSKVDESESLGPIINIPVLSGIPVSYITTGQRVPEDLRIARSKELAKLFLEKKEA